VTTGAPEPPMLQDRADSQVEIVWSGPSTPRVPVRTTEQVILDVVNGARSELLLMTYSAKPYPPLLEALTAAVSRGVHVLAVVETLQGAGSALSGSEPAAAFAAVPSVEIWHWPLGKRTESGAKMHAKLIVADDSVLFTTSANLTGSGVGKNIEAGLLVRGGSAPRRAAEHVRELRVAGLLTRYY
jgi:phosphatidylserine/phosphatidylglycerophosphate/cardiolipin synthase-like enzyme